MDEQIAFILAAIEHWIDLSEEYAPLDMTCSVPFHMVSYAILMSCVDNLEDLEDLDEMGVNDFNFGQPLNTGPLVIDGAHEGSMGAVIAFSDQDPQIVEMSALILPVSSLSQVIQNRYADVPSTDRCWLLLPLLRHYHNDIKAHIERAFAQGCSLAGRNHEDFVALFFAKNLTQTERLAEFLHDDDIKLNDLFGPQSTERLSIPSFGAAMKLATYGAFTGQSCDASDFVVTGACVQGQLRHIGPVGWINNKARYREQPGFEDSRFLVAAGSSGLKDGSSVSCEPPVEYVTDILEVITEIGWNPPTQQYIQYAQNNGIWAIEDFFTFEDDFPCQELPFDLEYISSSVNDGDVVQYRNESTDINTLVTQLAEESQSKCTFLLGFGGNGKSMLLRGTAARLAKHNEHNVTPIVVNLLGAEPQEGLAGIQALIQSNTAIEPYLQWLEDDAHFKNVVLLVDGWDDLTPDQRTAWLNILERSPVRHALIVSRFEHKPDHVERYWQLNSLSPDAILSYLSGEGFTELTESQKIQLLPFDNRMTLRMALWVVRERMLEQELNITRMMEFVVDELLDRGLKRYRASLTVLKNIFPWIAGEKNDALKAQYLRLMSDLAFFWVRTSGHQALSIEDFKRWHCRRFELDTQRLLYPQQVSQQDFLKFLIVDAHLLKVELKTQKITFIHGRILFYLAALSLDFDFFSLNQFEDGWLQEIPSIMKRDLPHPDQWLLEICSDTELHMNDLMKSSWIESLFHLYHLDASSHMFRVWLASCLVIDNDSIDRFKIVQKYVALNMLVRFMPSDSIDGFVDALIVFLQSTWIGFDIESFSVVASNIQKRSDNVLSELNLSRNFNVKELELRCISTPVCEELIEFYRKCYVFCFRHYMLDDALYYLTRLLFLNLSVLNLCEDFELEDLSNQANGFVKHMQVVSSIYSMIGGIYTSKSNNVKALFYCKRAIDVLYWVSGLEEGANFVRIKRALEIDDSVVSDLAKCYVRLGDVHSAAARFDVVKDDFDSTWNAVGNYKQAIDIYVFSLNMSSVKILLSTLQRGVDYSFYSKDTLLHLAKVCSKCSSAYGFVEKYNSAMLYVDVAVCIYEGVLGIDRYCSLESMFLSIVQSDVLYNLSVGYSRLAGYLDSVGSVIDAINIYDRSMTILHHLIGLDLFFSLEQVYLIVDVYRTELKQLAVAMSGVAKLLSQKGEMNEALRLINGATRIMRALCGLRYSFVTQDLVESKTLSQYWPDICIYFAESMLINEQDNIDFKDFNTLMNLLKSM